jgi:D-ribose pyranose/furanose isomerase RbsD
MRFCLRFVVMVVTVVIAVAVTGCGLWPRDRGGWKGAIDSQVAQLGYGNWIVIVEAAFPAHNRIGTRQVNSYRPIPEVLDEVLRTLEKTEHVRPRIYLPLELDAVENDYAPGIADYRRELEFALHGYETVRAEQDSLVTLALDAQRSLDVLVIRSSTALPYSSVFLELQPGYWDGDSESRLRQRLRKLDDPSGR